MSANYFTYQFCSICAGELHIYEDQLLSITEFRCHLCPQNTIGTEALEAHHRTTHQNPGFHACQLCAYALSDDNFLPSFRTVPRVMDYTHPVLMENILVTLGGNQSTASSVTPIIDAPLENPIEPEALSDVSPTTNGSLEPIDDPQCLSPLPARQEVENACSVCGNSFRSQTALKSHVRRVHTPKRKHECSTCGICFPGIRPLNNHVKLLHAANPNCGMCHKQFKNWATAKRHVAIVHSGIEVERCTTCDAPFHSHLSYTQHMRDQHGVTPRSVAARQLENVSEGIAKRRRGAIARPPRKMETCPICQTYYGNKANLARHIRIVHENDRPFKCENCGRLFGTNHNLQIHKTNQTACHGADR